MSILQRIDADFKEAMKAKDELALSVLRLVRTALKNKQIDVGHEASDDEILQVLRTMIKQYQDAISDFANAGRQDLVDRQQREIDLIARYLPPPMPREELERIVHDAIKSSGATEIGKAMGMVMKAVNGQADGKDVRAIVESYFGQHS
ncbi:GatB/YqeY domain-containing protein [Patescibacteria group bacterium]|nr:GatB/YqeY domain-containing protein [Patescibacteria group bacterium]